MSLSERLAAEAKKIDATYDAIAARATSPQELAEIEQIRTMAHAKLLEAGKSRALAGYDRGLFDV